MKKLTKYMVCLAALLVVAASTMGCLNPPGPPVNPPPTVVKATGGGWFYDIDTENKCTFGFNVNCDMDKQTLKGQMQFKDHGTGQKFHLEEMTFFTGSAERYAHFEGTDKGEIFVKVHVLDEGEPGWSEGDGIAIWYDHDVDPTWSGYLEGGNIQTHL